MAILHFTAPPAIGGIEGLMARQYSVLVRLGHKARYVVGRGSPSHGAETIQIPAMDPSNEPIQRARRETSQYPPTHDHPLVKQLVTDLVRALENCTDCWIHNALTVSLNPFLTRALEVLIARRPDIGWVAWCADLSTTSRFVLPHDREVLSCRPVVHGVTWVAISETRARELSVVLALPPERIRVIHPPLDILTWLNVGAESRRVIETTRLLESDLVVLVPAKALPHKRLVRAVGVASHLARGTPRVHMLLTAASSPHEPDLSLRVRETLRIAIQEAGLAHTVFILPDLVGKDPAGRTVRELMHVSDVVFLPSAEEGFGMPLLEAATCRVPVVCTDIPVFREVAGDAALYFGDEWNDERVASSILAAADATGNSHRRSALATLRRFEADLEHLLRLSVHPKV